jgi:hypothetical protein
MKKVVLLVILVISFVLVSKSQKFNFDETKPKLLKALNSSKVTELYLKKGLKPRSFSEKYLLNYSFTNQPFAFDLSSGPITVTFMKLNRNYSNSDRGTLKDLLQYYGSNGELYHIFGASSSKYVYKTIDITKTSIKIDSIFTPFAYFRKNNTTDSMVLSIYDLSNVTIPNATTNNGTPISITYNNAPLYRSAIAINSAIAYTDTFNFTGGTTFPYTDYKFSPNISIPAGKAFGIRLEFVGDTGNYFQPIFDMYDECQNCVVTRAYIPNTTGYLNYIFPSTPPFNFSGALNRQGMFACSEPQNCNYYYPQTFKSSVFVTSTTAFNVKIDPVSNIRGCNTTVLNINSSYTGLDTAYSVRMLWRATGGKFENGFDTFTGPSAKYTFDSVGGFISIILKGTGSNNETASDTIGLENWSMNPSLTSAGKITCLSQDSIKLSIANTAAVGINSSMVTAYDAITTRNLVSSLNDLNAYFGLTYTWSGAGLYPRIDTTFTYTKTAGNKDLTIKNFVGCTKTVSYNAINSAATPPILDFTVSPKVNTAASPIEVCQNVEITFTTTSSATKNGWNYTWKEGSTAFSSTGASVTRTFTTAGTNKSITINADSGGCVSAPVSKSINVLASTSVPKCKSSISNSNLSDNITIFPNPVKEGIMNVKNESSLAVSIKVTDIMGKTVSKDNLNAAKTGPIDLSNLNNGVYFIEIESKNDRIVRKVIVDKQ